MLYSCPTYCAERERQLRKKPLPTRFRGDNDWELFIRNFPDDTTEVINHLSLFIHSWGILVPPESFFTL